MFRICVIGDTHLDERSFYFDEHVAVLERAVASALGHKPDLLAVCGDLCGRDSDHPWSVRERMAWLRVLCEAKRERPDMAVIVLPGNHDQAAEMAVFDYARDGIAAFTRAAGVTVGGAFVWVAPYQTSLAGWTPPPKPVPGTLSVMLAHQPVKGVSVGGFEIVSPNDVELTPDELNAGGYDAVLLGHVHEHQQVADRAWYTGSTVALRQGESDAKGYLLCELPGPGERPRVELQAVTSWRMRSVEWVGEAAEYDVRNAHVRCVVSLGRDAVLTDAEKAAMRDALTRQGALSVRVKIDRPTEVLGRVTAITTVTSDEDKLRAAVRERGADGEQERRVVGRFGEVKRAEVAA